MSEPELPFEVNRTFFSRIPKPKPESRRIQIARRTSTVARIGGRFAGRAALGIARSGANLASRQATGLTPRELVELGILRQRASNGEFRADEGYIEEARRLNYLESRYNGVFGRTGKALVRPLAEKRKQILIENKRAQLRRLQTELERLSA